MLSIVHKWFSRMSFKMKQTSHARREVCVHTSRQNIGPPTSIIADTTSRYDISRVFRKSLIVTLLPEDGSDVVVRAR